MKGAGTVVNRLAVSLARAIEQHPLIWDGVPIRLSAAFGAYCFNGS